MIYDNITIIQYHYSLSFSDRPVISMHSETYNKSYIMYSNNDNGNNNN